MPSVKSTVVFCAALLATAAAFADPPVPHPTTRPDNNFNADFLFTVGRNRLSEGDLTSARALLTRALTVRTDFANAYAARAVAEANLGNFSQAQSDLALAAEYHANGDLETWAKEEVGRASKSPAPQGDPWENLTKEALAGAPFEKLVPLAVALVKAKNATRVRWDELYQSRLRVLESAVREKPNDTGAILALADFLYNESVILGEPLSPKGGMRYYRFAGDDIADREIHHADALYDQVLQKDPQNVRALTGKAAMRMEYYNWQEGVEYVKKALATGKPTPELLVLLSRILADNGSSNAYTALDLRTPKTWLTFGVGVTIQWTHQPTDAERQRSDQLNNVANELFSQADAQLEAAAKAKAGTPDGDYYAGLLANYRREPDAALKDFESAVKGDPQSRRDRLQLAGAYLAAGRTQEAVAQQEILTLQRETTDRYHLAAAWSAIDQQDYVLARKELTTAAAIDPADSRVAAYMGSVAIAENKPAESAGWCEAALALEEAQDLFRGVTLTPTAAPVIDTTPEKNAATRPATAPAPIANPLNGDEASMAILLNIRAANRYTDLKEPDKALAALGWNAAIQRRLTPQAMRSTPARASLPDPAAPSPQGIRSVANLVAWSHVYYGHALLNAGKIIEAYKVFDGIARWKRLREFYEPQGLAVAGAIRLKMAGTNPQNVAHKTWLANARLMEVLSSREMQAITQRRQGQSQLARTGMADQQETARLSQELVDLYYFQSLEPVKLGAYDARNNANFKGTNDYGPDDGQPVSTGGPLDQNGKVPRSAYPPAAPSGNFGR